MSIEAARRIAHGATAARALVINLRAEMNAVPGLEGRTPEMEAGDLDPAFGRSFPYRDGIISTIKFSGRSAWERHPDEEIVIVIGGSGFLMIREDDGTIRPQSLSENFAAVVPPGRWHQIESERGISLVTVTPQPTEHER